MKLTEIASRLSTLEASRAVPEFDPDWERAGMDIAAFIEQKKQERAEYEAMDAKRRVHHWQGKINEAEAYVSEYGSAPPPTPPWSPVNEYGFKRLPASVEESIDRSMWLLVLKKTKDGLRGEYKYELTSARVERLGELGYDPEALKPWREKVEQFKKLPWEWSVEYVQFPADALAMLEADQKPLQSADVLVDALAANAVLLGQDNL